jgi:hypothetical protein
VQHPKVSFLLVIVRDNAHAKPVLMNGGAADAKMFCRFGDGEFFTSRGYTTKRRSGGLLPFPPSPIGLSLCCELVVVRFSTN